MEKMLCPSCRSPLIPYKMGRYESLEEHVGDPNGIPSMKQSYQCSDEKCLTREFNICWTEDGGRYGGFGFNKQNFIGGNDAPFGTYSRKANVSYGHLETLKHDQHLIRIGNIKFKLEYHYEGDEDGNVIGKTTKLRVLKYDRGSWYFHTIPIVGFFGEIKSGFKAKILCLKEKRTPFYYKMNFSVMKHEKRWWRNYGVAVNRFLFPKIAKQFPLKGY